jgi:hypothetical protein
MGSIATKIDHSDHFRLSPKFGSAANIAVGPVRANNGHSGKPTKRLSLYVTSEQATRSSHLASSAITNEMFAKEPNDARVGRLCGELRLARIPPSATLFSMTAAPPASSAWRSYVENGLSPSFNFFSVWTVPRYFGRRAHKKAPQKRGACS